MTKKKQLHTKVALITLLLLLILSLFSGCKQTDISEETISNNKVIEQNIYTPTEEENKQIDALLKRIDASVHTNNVVDFSKEFTLTDSDYSESELNDINTKLLLLIENKHDFFSYVVNSISKDNDNNIEVNVNFGYKNLDDTKGTSYDLKLTLANDETDNTFFVTKVIFLDK
ncbi:hypothetical protein [Helicovermis profundi]|uniref:Lipoprotein n=1 Tax=Helicovermis profundi TaxID=3065157 RepID=A0AAU9ESZ6_9FIRM|nr:hypothetical protein HLPR_05060 [Clostridia bacterium S502]